VTAKQTTITLVVLVAAFSLMLAAILRTGGWRGLLPRGEVAEVPEDECPPLSREEIREALLTALSDSAVLSRRLEAMSKRPELRDLHKLPKRLEALYVLEVDR